MAPSGIAAPAWETSSTACTKRGTAVKNYFDLLTHDAISNVIRFVSVRPRRSNWMSYVTAEDALTLFQCSSPLSTVACETLTSFCSVAGPDGIPVILSNMRGQKQLVSILAHAGHGFREVHLGGTARDSHIWLPVFQKECVNVRTISSRGDVPLELVLCAIGAELENLSIFQHRLTSLEIHTISRHCTALRKLTLRVNKECYEQLADIWSNVGEHLQELYIDDGGGIGFKRMFENIGNYCLKLKAITFAVDTQSASLAAQLCAQIGARLEFVSFNSQEVPAHVLDTIARGCQNVKIKDVSACGEKARDVLDTIGTKTHSARFSNDSSVIVIDDCFARVAANCNVMQEITLHLNEDQMSPFLRGFLRTPKPLLETVSIVFEDFRSCSEESAVECISILSRRDTNLKQFKLLGPNVPKGTFSKFVDNNKNLEAVSITSPPMTESEEVIELEVSIVNDFSRCPHIKDLTLNGPGGFSSERIPALEDACLPFRIKGACAYIRYSFYVQ